jgi:hypothetical protein
MLLAGGGGGGRRGQDVVVERRRGREPSPSVPASASALASGVFDRGLRSLLPALDEGFGLGLEELLELRLDEEERRLGGGVDVDLRSGDSASDERDRERERFGESSSRELGRRSCVSQ